MEASRSAVISVGRYGTVLEKYEVVTHTAPVLPLAFHFHPELEMGTSPDDNCTDAMNKFGSLSGTR